MKAINIQMHKYFKIVVLAFFWLIFPPLFLLFSIIWKIPKLVSRIVLTILSPLSILVIIYGLLIVHHYYYYYIERGSRSEIERKTEMPFPDYKTISSRVFTNNPSFLGDFNMVFTIQLDTVNIQDFYEKIDSSIKHYKKSTNNSSPVAYWWLNENGCYSFTHFDEPDDPDDQVLRLDVNKSNGQVIVTIGSD